MGSDKILLKNIMLYVLFQSTPPVWGATFSDRAFDYPLSVSIHAPRVGSDLSALYFRRLDLVSIHAPRVGSDDQLQNSSLHCGCFNPRPPCGERHFLRRVHSRPPYVSIHAPRVGSDIFSAIQYFAVRCFNPRPPCGERPP